MKEKLKSAKEDAVRMVQELTQQHQVKISEIFAKHEEELQRAKQRHTVLFRRLFFDVARLDVVERISLQEDCFRSLDVTSSFRDCGE